MGGAVTTPTGLLRLDESDDVLIATRTLAVGEQLVVDGTVVTTLTEVPTGFKVAGRDLDPGDVVHRLGVPIGRMTRSVRCGDIVHVHNLESQYLRTHQRGEA